jgi:sulfur-oxidizing protein SoxY
LFILLGSSAWATPYSFSPEDDPQDSVVWQRVRQSLFGERPIQQASSQLLTLKVPARALDSAFVPVQVVAGPASGSVQTLYLIADANPSPLAAKIQFLALGMPVNFETRIRIDAYTHIRVVAETSDGQLFMATGFIKATGGCAAPATIDAQEALERLGIMSFKVDPGSRSQGLRRVRWRMEHPNHSGFVMEQHTRLNIPADYVQSIQVQFNGEPVLSAEVDFSLSENPSLEFSLPNLKPGVLRVLALDSSGRRFEGRQALDQSSVHIVAPGVYAVVGDETAHRGNAGFIVGPQGVMVIDSGASWAQGQDLIAKVRHITSLPIQLLLLTHAKDEFIFGATATFLEALAFDDVFFGDFFVIKKTLVHTI